MDSNQIKSIKVTFLGDFEADKYSVIQNFLHQIGAESHNCGIVKVLIDGQPVKLDIYDTTYQEEFENLGPIYYKDADICVLVYNEASKKSFEKIKIWKNEFVATLALQDEKNYPFLLIGNNPNGSFISVEDSVASEYAENNNMMFYRFSSQNNSRFLEIFKSIIKKAIERKQKNEIPVPKINTNSQPENKSFRCMIC